MFFWLRRIIYPEVEKYIQDYWDFDTEHLGLVWLVLMMGLGNLRIVCFIRPDPQAASSHQHLGFIAQQSFAKAPEHSGGPNVAIFSCNKDFWMLFLPQDSCCQSFFFRCWCFWVSGISTWGVHSWTQVFSSTQKTWSKVLCPKWARSSCQSTSHVPLNYHFLCVVGFKEKVNNIPKKLSSWTDWSSNLNFTELGKGYMKQ